MLYIYIVHLIFDIIISVLYIFNFMLYIMSTVNFNYDGDVKLI